MEFINQQIKEMEQYLPPLTRRPDFREFWDRNLQKSAALPLNARLTSRENPFDGIQSFDLWYDSADGATTCHGLLVLPEKSGRLPVVLQFHGYSWYCGQVSDQLSFVNMGMAVLSMDHRGQNGLSPDKHAYNADSLDFMTRGCEDKEDYTVKWSILDGVRAVDYLLSRPDIDDTRLFTHGSSQGGAMALSVACMDPRVRYCFCDVPSNCNIERRIQNRNGSFSQVTEYLRRRPDKLEQVYQTLSYFDIMNMAEYCKADVYASVGLKDTTCPAICFYAAYNRLPGKKQIAVYPFAEHEGGWFHYNEKKLRLIRELLDR